MYSTSTGHDALDAYQLGGSQIRRTQVSACEIGTFPQSAAVSQTGQHHVEFADQGLLVPSIFI